MAISKRDNKHRVGLVSLLLLTRPILFFPLSFFVCLISFSSSSSSSLFSFIFIFPVLILSCRIYNAFLSFYKDQLFKIIAVAFQKALGRPPLTWWDVGKATSLKVVDWFRNSITRCLVLALALAPNVNQVKTTTVHLTRVALRIYDVIKLWTSSNKKGKPNGISMCL